MSHPSEPVDGLPGHLERLTRVPLLSVDAEIELATRARGGDPEAKGKLVESNMRLVIAIARTYRNRQIPMEDLVQEGAIGLMQAADRYDPNRGFRFSTYATHWIRQAIGRAIDNKAKSIRLPAHVAQSLRRIEKSRAEFARATGREPGQEELAAAVGITPRKLQTLLDASHELLSLETPVGPKGDSTLGGILPDEDALNAEEQVLTSEVLAELGAILRELTDREQRVMQVKYRIDGGLPPQTVDIEKELSLTRDRLRQIEAQAIRKLRAIVQRRRLAELFGRDLPDTPEPI